LPPLLLLPVTPPLTSVALAAALVHAPPVIAELSPAVELTILVMGLVVIPASAATSAAQRAAAMLQQLRGAFADSPGGASHARAIPGSSAGADAGCNISGDCRTHAFAPVGRQVEREQAAAVPSTR
jgi:hypothetical protein